MKKNRLLVLYAHPAQHRSEANRPLFNVAQKMAGVTTVDMYAEYPKFNINIDLEQQRLLDHDVIIFQFPLYWYSTPAILKEWQDLVLEYGFAYGTDGTALKDKLFVCALTAGGKHEAYHADGYNHFTIRELLQPLEQMARLTHMRYLPPLALFGSRTALEEKRVEKHTLLYGKMLNALLLDQVSPDSTENLETLNEFINQLDEEKSA
ncbi:NAD(P)H-dependent oxidoreductase [Vibrio agarivorans]|uniref:NAD(P)H-dependent oxidoreductase n=1 Tax=Vibrio agarivorans TaxID=153622 RepID=UPI0022307D5A|nr:NAD(P)H-dependent oxidoreductase [Vibrio agarivorans]